MPAFITSNLTHIAKGVGVDVGPKDTPAVVIDNIRSAVDPDSDSSPAKQQRLPNRKEQLAKAEAQRAAESTEIPTLSDAMGEFLGRKSRSFGEDVIALENRITATVADPSVYQSRIAKVARIAAANNRAFEDLVKMLDAIQKKFGADPAKARDRGNYFNVSVTNWLKRHPPDSGAAP